MAVEIERNPALEWLDHVQPVGLVVAPTVLEDLGLVPEPQTAADTGAVAELVTGEREGSALRNPWAFVQSILDWPAARVAGSPGGPTVPNTLVRKLDEHDTLLEPTWAVAAAGHGATGFQLLVRIESAGVDPDTRGALGGWEATPQQRFERLLRESDVHAGFLITDHALRLVYAPRGETSGHLTFPIRPLATVAGRPMLGGLKLLLSTFRLFNDATNRRLPALLEDSRKAQAHVSTALAEQVLGALHELLRGLDAAEDARLLVRELAASRPAHLYEGLLAVLMRLVFILYAEDRDLLPSRTDGRAKALYETSYSVRGLYAQLLEDTALNPDTMDERRGGWGRFLALFRLIHGGHRSGFIHARGGALFDPESFPFLEGRRERGELPAVLKLADGCILRVLDRLMTLKKRGRQPERLSYRTLDVEQIGSVYETVMGFTVTPAKGRVLAIRAGKNNRAPVFVDLDELAGKDAKDRLKDLKENAKRGQLTKAQEDAVKRAQTALDLASALDPIVDERGSPKKQLAASGTPILQPTDERRRTGSHYTPRSLTEPIVRHALEPAFDRLGPDATPEQVLDLKVCDPAMGSGAFLVEACRALASRLGQAWARWPDLRPAIPVDEDEDLHARRLVAQRCLYGVDKNPRAVDLAKLSLWLATLAKDHEFTFLDHALKCGDSLVGLSNAQMAAASWDERQAPLPLLRGLVEERVQAALDGRREIREAPDDVGRAIQEARYRTVEQRLDHARAIGDAVIAAFFSAEKANVRERKRREVESWLQGGGGNVAVKLAELAATLRQGAEHEQVRSFHWELEFPEAFACAKPGFDAIVGNPPFLGGKRISAEHGENYNSWLSIIHIGAAKNTDLVAHFFRRAYRLLNEKGTFGLIATNTIGQGDTRRGGLEYIIINSGYIYNAISRLRWPGEAAVIVSIIHVLKGAVHPAILNRRRVRRISAYLVEGDLNTSPGSLAANSRKAFIGSYLRGKGFIFDDNNRSAFVTSVREMQDLISVNRTNAECIRPYIGGKEVNNDPNQCHRRYVIDFTNVDVEQANALWPDLIKVLEKKVRPERIKLHDSPANRDHKERWWQFANTRPELYAAIDRTPQVIVTNCGAAPHLAFAFLPTRMIYAHTLTVVAFSACAPFAVLQTRVHELWARFFSSSMKDDLRYTPKTCFRTFPFPVGFETDQALEAAGKAYHEYRATLMVRRQEGLTKTYNRFHKEGEQAADIVRLRELHAAMDAAVLRAYGWDDLTVRAEPVFLEQDADEGKTAKTRLDWSAEFKDELLARLLALNAERADAEAAAGLTPDTAEDEDDEELEDEEEAA